MTDLDHLAWTCLVCGAKHPITDAGLLLGAGYMACCGCEPTLRARMLDAGPIPPALDHRAMERALRNCLTHARRMMKRVVVGGEDWAHIVRFCATAGVVPDVMRNNLAPDDDVEDACPCGVFDSFETSATLIKCRACGRLWGRCNDHWVLDPDTVPHAARFRAGASHAFGTLMGCSCGWRPPPDGDIEDHWALHVAQTRTP